MAKYTELLSEYIEDGGELPAVFEQIIGFDELFVGYYCDAEIAFETPTLFSIKLNTMANMVIPVYAQRITALKELYRDVLNPRKIRTKTGQVLRQDGQSVSSTENTKEGTQTTKNSGIEGGAMIEEVKTFEEPFALGNAAPAPTQPETIAETTRQPTATEVSYDGYKDTTKQTISPRTNTETYNNVTDLEEGYTPGEALQIINEFTTKRDNILRECLGEFSPLFLEIY